MNNSSRCATTTRLEQRRQSNLYRQRQVSEAATPSRQFGGNDYLSLSRHPYVIEAARQALDDFGAGSTGSPLLSGYSREHQALEYELANWLQVESVVLFNSGFAANHGVITSLLKEAGGKVFCDRLCHASLLEGVRHSKLSFKRFPHNQPDNVNAASGDWLVTEGTFSMDGDRVEAASTLQQTKQQQLNLLLDDAHGLGCWGPQGLGSFAELRPHTRLLTGTFGKAFGVAGAFVAGSTDDIDYLQQFCREYIYSTAFPPTQAAAIRASLAVIRSTEGAQRRERLQQRIEEFRQGLQQRQLATIDSPSAIQTWLVGDEERTMTLGKYLNQHGFAVSSVRPPTVPAGSARLRFSLQADHQSADIQQLFAVIDQLLETT